MARVHNHHIRRGVEQAQAEVVVQAAAVVDCEIQLRWLGGPPRRAIVQGTRAADRPPCGDQR